MGGFEGSKGKEEMLQQNSNVKNNHRTVLGGFATCRDGVERKIM